MCNGRTDNAVKNRFIAINKKRQNAKGKGKGKAGNSSKPPPTLPAGMGSSPVRRVQLKHGLSIQIPQGPFVRNASAAFILAILTVLSFGHQGVPKEKRGQHCID